MSNAIITLISDPLLLPVAFLLVAIISAVFVIASLRYADNAKGTVLRNGTIALILWLGLTGVLALNGFYLKDDAMPPRVFYVLFPLILITAWLLTGKRKNLSVSLSFKMLTLFHVIRIPVELILFGLYKEGLIPRLMTFEGRNFDILAGLSAPLIYFAAIHGKNVKAGLLLGWNIVSLLLLINIVVNALLSVQTPFQQFAFDQPNQAVLLFPYVWLPAIVVPVVAFCHLASIMKLLALIRTSNHTQKVYFHGAVVK